MGREMLAEAAARIVIAYLESEGVPASEMGALVGAVRGALNRAGSPPPLPSPPPKGRPAVRPSKSISQDFLICLVCGKKLMTLRRHLGEAHNHSPGDYRARFNLPDDFPMDAPAYREVRSALAKARGLGKRILWEERPPADPDRRRRRRREAALLRSEP